MLREETITLLCADKGPAAPVPDLMGITNVQYGTNYDLGEEDEVFQGYGRRSTIYPYRLYTEYTREVKPTRVKALVLENDLMRAVFLPEFGGRLWSLRDKVKNRDVVYTNDVLRGSNLSVRGPWFSGGVEWNMGVIGHTPLTMEPIFASELEHEDGPVLRMYAYERIRGMVYQMDFWLDPNKPALNCHMAVFNQSMDVVPMYWWSNIACPEYEDGRVFVPAHKAYTQAGNVLHAVPIPVEGELDSTRYENIPVQRDYFYDLEEDAPRWIANLDRRGCGLFHSSTRRLKSRKLFVWGNTTGGKNWQKFLTEQAGDYLEIQAGLAKTQYGCIPMPPCTTWQWTERYELLDLDCDTAALDFDGTNEKISTEYFPQEELDRAERLGRSICKADSRVIFRGNGDAQLENKLREKLGEVILTPHLDFTSEDHSIDIWSNYLDSGMMMNVSRDEPPAYDLTGPLWRRVLEREMAEGFPNWYVCYELALLKLEAGQIEETQQTLWTGLAQRSNAWGWYALAALELLTGNGQNCRNALNRGLELHHDDPGYNKLCMEMLTRAEDWEGLLRLVERQEPPCTQDPRVKLYHALALHHMGANREAMDILAADGGLCLPDIRECELASYQLWQDIQEKLTGERTTVPDHMNYNSFA